MKDTAVHQTTDRTNYNKRKRTNNKPTGMTTVDVKVTELVKLGTERVQACTR